MDVKIKFKHGGRCTERYISRIYKFLSALLFEPVNKNNISILTFSTFQFLARCVWGESFCFRLRTRLVRKVGCSSGSRVSMSNIQLTVILRFS